MITSVKYLVADSTSPYRNLAIEEYLMGQVEKNTCVLYLWQDRNTVEIGRNQNARKELRLNEIGKNGCRISRRLAGGGACYHDLGNLNFSFLTLKEEMDDKQLSGIILRAVRGLGIDAGRSESGILMADGRKFCNSVTYTKGEYSCYRGSIMVSSNLTRVCKYINPASARLKSKGADSIRSKVVNLQECLSSLTVEALREQIIDTMGHEFGSIPRRLGPGEMDEDRVRALEEKNASQEWTMGGFIPYTYELAERMPWGCLQIQLEMEQGWIKEAAAYSDSTEVDVIQKIPQVLVGSCFTSPSMIRAIERLKSACAGSERELSMVSDIQSLIAQQDI